MVQRDAINYHTYAHTLEFRFMILILLIQVWMIDDSKKPADFLAYRGVIHKLHSTKGEGGNLKM